MDGRRIVGRNEEQDIPSAYKVGRRNPVNHHGASLGGNLAIRSDGCLRRDPLRLAGEQEYINGGSVSRASGRRRSLLGHPRKAEGAGQAFPRTVTSVEGVGHVDDRNTGGPEGFSDGREVQGSCTWRAGSRAASQQYDCRECLGCHPDNFVAG